MPADLDMTTALVESATQWFDERRPDETTELATGELGRYRLEGVLGRGGMGIVYAAFDPELERRVALKVMRVGAGGSTSAGEAEARLLREAQALGGLAHPNVVTVYDVGRIGDRVYIAMELVEGQTLKRWIEAGPHPWAHVVEVLLEAGRGLVAAHQQGIVHRDFKPANVLLGTDGRARVADFGLARSDDAHDLSGSSRGVDAVQSSESLSSRLPILTEAGAVMGTPGYMAPEQAAGEALDARSDQFSFCVTLYEALYGHRPHAGRTRREWMRNARLGQVRDPPADRRVPGGLRRVVLRGLAPDPDARWPALDALLVRLERQLGRGRRAAAWGLAGGAAIVSGLVAWTGLASRDEGDPCARVGEEMRGVWNDEESARVALALSASDVPHADELWARLRPRFDEHATQWIAARERTCRSRDLDAATRDLQVSCLSRRRAELAALVDVLATPDAEAVRGVIMAAARLQSISACEDPLGLAESLEPPPPEHAGRVQTLREQLASVSVYRETRRFERALEVGRAVLRAADEVGYAPLRAEVRYRQGRTHLELADYETAAEHLQDAFYVAHACGHDELAAEAASSLFFLHAYRRGDPDAASRWLGHAQAATERMGDAGGNARWRLAQDRGAVALREADYARAEELLTQALELARKHYGEDNLAAAGIIGNLGVARLNRGDADGARSSFEQSLEISERIAGPEYPDRASWLNNLGVIEQNRGHHEASLDYFRQAYDIESMLFGDTHPSVAMSLNNIGGALAYLGRDVEAKDYFERSIAAYEATEGFDPLDLSRPIGNLGRTLSALGDHSGGIARLLEAIRIVEQVVGADHPELAAPCLNLGSIYLRVGEHENALAQMQRALDIDRTTFGPQHPFVASTLASMGEVHLDRGNHELAIELIEQALAIQEREEVDPVHLAATRFGLARALWPDRRRRARARELVELAEQGLEGAGAAGADRLAALRTWRARH